MSFIHTHSNNYSISFRFVYTYILSNIVHIFVDVGEFKRFSFFYIQKKQKIISKYKRA